MKYRLTEKILPEDSSEIYKGLTEFNLSVFEDMNIRNLGVYLEDEKGKKLAGLIGDTHGNWLNVKFLWVDESLRGKGIGTVLMGKAEEEAKARGCKYSFLDTFQVQAPEFYKKLGYKEVLALPNYPITGTRYYFTKDL